jgi:hypothetical protein
MVAVSFVGLCVAAALVLDFGVARADRTANKAAADASVAAGIRSLEAADGTLRPFAAACAALAYLRVNSTTFSTSAGVWTTGAGVPVGDPCSSAVLLAQTCIPNAETSWAWFRATVGTRHVDIKAGYVLPAPDPGASEAGGCDQLAVTIQESNQPGLGQLVTSAKTVTNSRSVARASPGAGGLSVPALVLLERCGQALDVGGTASVQVLGDGSAAGSIHADSDGSCASATAAVFDGGQPASIQADRAITGTAPGVISTVALSAVGVPTFAYDSLANVVAQGQPGPPANGPTGRLMVGRGVVDKRYLSAVNSAILVAGTRWSAEPPAGAGVTTYTGAACNGINGSIPGSTVYFQCPVADFANATLPAATLVVFTGRISVATNGRSLNMPLAREVYVKGATGSAIDLKGTLNINDGAGITCPSAASPATSRLVVGTGSFSAGAQAQVRLCGTAVVMADNSGTPPCDRPLSAVLPGAAPNENNCQGAIQLGGGAAIVWTAPNVTDAPTTDYSQLEDLALWTETRLNNSLGGGGALSVSGVFFAPNAKPLSVSGGATSAQPANAQFLARQIFFTGGSKLSMRPNRSNSVSIPAPTQYSLVR